MSTGALSIAQLGTMDEGGGAAAVAAGLTKGLLHRGHNVCFLVGRKRGHHPAIDTLPDDDRPWFRVTGYTALQRALSRLAARHPDRGFGLIGRSLRLATHPRAVLDRYRGVEDFEFPGSHRVFESLGSVPDILHAHNLHGGYFDLRAIGPLSTRALTVVTLHDMWMLTGHCAHALQCDRWLNGCGQCPDLARDPAIRRDATSLNWLRKRDVYARSRLHVATPSKWLRDQVVRSMLAPFARDVRVIPNGVDTTVLFPGDRHAARRRLGLPPDRATVLLTTGSRGSMWKDDRALRSVMEQLVMRRGSDSLQFVAVGRESAVRDTMAPTRSVPYVHEPAVMAQYYRAADIYLHAARADTFPLAILEAMACGTSVVASAIGGIPEQLRSAGLDAVRSGRVGDATGILTNSAGEMADAVDTLLDHPASRAAIGGNAVKDVAERFTSARQVDAYLAWYRELLTGTS